IAGAGVIATVYGTYLWFKSHPDIVSILTVFVTSLAVLLWIGHRRRDAPPTPRLDHEPSGEYSSSAEIAELHAKLSDCEQAQLRVDTLAEQVWKLKDEAREIRRRWPGCDFVHRPASLQSWR